MKYSDSQLRQATRGTALFAELMSSITQTTLRHQIGYIPDVMDVIQERRFTFTVELNERKPEDYMIQYEGHAFYDPSLEKYQTVLTAEFNMCSNCLMNFRYFLEKGTRMSRRIVTVYPSHYNEMTCEICGESQDGLPF